MKWNFIDTHCHLEMKAFDEDRAEVVKRSEDANVRYIINAGSDREGNIGGLQVSSEYEHVYPAVGIHPHDAMHLDETLMDELRSWAEEPKVVAIGEIGLDYHYLHSPMGAQIDAFRRQIALAREMALPVIVHSREAEKDTMRILQEEIRDIPGVLHCFSGNIDMAREAMELGLLISFAGPVTFKKAEKLREVVSYVPDEFLLIETDAPYLSPVPMRGKRNEPSFLQYTASVLAEMRGITVSDLARITTLNAMKLFRIGGVSERGEIAYRIRDSLYLNVTRKCTNRCGFCIRFRTNYVKGHNLRLERDPSALQVIKAIEDPREYREIVFCGLGEPLLRLDLVKKVSRWIKQQGGKVRINTNGHGSLIHGRNILPELKGLVDSFSISLDAESQEIYEKVCKPTIKGAYEGMLEFIKEAKKITEDVTVTVVSIPEIDVEKCRAIAKGMGVGFRVRKFNVVG